MTLIEVSTKRKGEKVIMIRLVLNSECIIEVAEVIGDFFAEYPDVLEKVLQDLKGSKVAGLEWGEFLRNMARISGLYGVSRETLDSLAVKLAEEVGRACREGIAGT